MIEEPIRGDGEGIFKGLSDGSIISAIGFADGTVVITMLAHATALQINLPLEVARGFNEYLTSILDKYTP